jgi:hypothetical protein
MGSAPWSICAGIGVFMIHLKAEGRSKGVNRRGYLRLQVFSEEFLVCRVELRAVLNEEMGASYRYQTVQLNKELHRTTIPSY